MDPDVRIITVSSGFIMFTQRYDLIAKSMDADETVRVLQARLDPCWSQTHYVGFSWHGSYRFILDLLEKCHEIHELFKKSTEELQEGRANLDHSEQTIDRMQTTVKTFGETMDSLGVHLLQGNLAVAQRNIQTDRLRKEIATRKDRLEKHEEVEQTDKHGKTERLNEMRTNREKLELQLRKVNGDIDSAYEEMFETQEKLYALKDLREIRRESESQELAILKDKAGNSTTRKRAILTVTDGKAFDMSDMYVSPTAFAVLEADIEALKHQQIQVQRHIQMQLEEREFLRETANAVMQRVFDLEKKVRKETGDHGWESALTTEPNWLQDLSGPSIWYTSPPLSLDQLNRLREMHYQNYSYAHAICDRDETEATSGETPDDIVVIDIVGDSTV